MAFCAASGNATRSQARRLHRARHRHGVREGARVRDRRDGHGTVRGVGRKRQGLTHMQSGTVADIAAVVDNCQVALQEAEEMAGFRPTPGGHRHRRRAREGLHDDAHARSASSPISRSTTRELVDAHRLGPERGAARGGAHRSPGRPACPTSTSASSTPRSTGASIDGYALTNPVGFQGRHVKISIFNAFAPLVHLGALQSVASQLDLELLEIVAEPYAVRACSAPIRSARPGALFVDVGGGTTDVALVRQGGIEGTRMFALGGRAFTKSLADRLDLPFPRAEELKVDYARGSTSSERDEVAAIIGDDVAVWAAGVELVMEELAGGDLLPAGSTCAAAGRACPRSARPLAAEPSGSACRSPGRPRSR